MQLAPPINNIVSNLTKGKVTHSLIKTANGWHVIKVDDIRPFVIKAFDQAKNTITQALIQEKRQEGVNILVQK